DEFVLSGHPHLEEAYWFGEGVLPILERNGLWSHPDGPTETADHGIPFTGARRTSEIQHQQDPVASS
ncbi:hypothetical protein NL463_28910, partial [Klebsiella pneumoniae]|nr:hypothetical protein [Klebsiella pneumoniae]